MMRTRRILTATSIIVAFMCATAYVRIRMLSRKPPEQFALIADLPLDDTRDTLAADLGSGQAANDRIRAAIRPRLLAAYRTLAYADSGKWSLATWAQLQWVRDTLDGSGLDEIEAGIKVDPVCRDLSFARLLYEFVRTASPDQRQASTDTMRDGIAIVEELSAMTPNTNDPLATLKHVVSEIESAPGLQSLVSGFPRFGDISPPRGDR